MDAKYLGMLLTFGAFLIIGNNFLLLFFNSMTVRLLYMSQPDGYDYLFQPFELHDRAKDRVWFHPTTIYPRREKTDWI